MRRATSTIWAATPARVGHRHQQPTGSPLCGRSTHLDLPDSWRWPPPTSKAGLAERVQEGPPGGPCCKPEVPLPGEADIWWMSPVSRLLQPRAEIIRHTNRVDWSRNRTPGSASWSCSGTGRLFQEAASFSLNAASLYFTCLASGNGTITPNSCTSACAKAHFSCGGRAQDRTRCHPAGCPAATRAHVPAST